MKKQKFTAEELELIEVLKTFGTRRNLQKEKMAAYNALSKRGRRDILDAALPPLYKTWTLEGCKKSAKKYKTRGAWREGDVNAYSYAVKNNLLDECCKHMLHHEMNA